MTWGDFSLYQSRNRLYARSVDVREDFLAIRRSRASLTTAMSWHAALARKLPLGAENDRLMALLFGCMKHLALGADPLAADVRFFWRWANLWGVAPEVESCAECGLPCGECAQAMETGRPDISHATAKRIARIVSAPASEFAARSHEMMDCADAHEMSRAREWISCMIAL